MVNWQICINHITVVSIFFVKPETTTPETSERQLHYTMSIPNYGVLSATYVCKLCNCTITYLRYIELPFTIYIAISIMNLNYNPLLNFVVYIITINDHCVEGPNQLGSYLLLLIYYSNDKTH